MLALLLIVALILLVCGVFSFGHLLWLAILLIVAAIILAIFAGVSTRR